MKRTCGRRYTNTNLLRRVNSHRRSGRAACLEDKRACGVRRDLERGGGCG